jgi:hypothetical protein
VAYGYRIRPTVKGCSWENAVAEVADEAAVFLEKFSEDVGYVPVQLWCVSCKGAYRQIRSIFLARLGLGVCLLDWKPAIRLMLGASRSFLIKWRLAFG